MSKNSLFIGVGAVLSVIILWILVLHSQPETESLTTTETAEVITTALDAPTTSDSQDETLAEPANDTGVDAAADSETTDASIDNTAVSTPEPANQSETDLAAENTPSAGAFVDYRESELTAGTNVLFFHAAWCPSCRGLERDIVANAADIPADVTIFQVDYATETALNQQYGVTYQHTLVVVDQEGNQVRKLTGLTNTLDQVVSQL